MTVSQAQVNSLTTVTVPETMQVYSAGDSEAGTITGSLTKNVGVADPSGDPVIAVLPLGGSQAVTADAFAKMETIQLAGGLLIGGTFTLRPVPPGTWDVAYVLSNYTPEGLESITVREWRTAVVVPEGGSVQLGSFNYASAGSPVVSGYVYDTSNNPVVGARVMIASPANMLMGSAETNQNGYWAVYNLPDRENYIAQASHPFLSPNPGQDSRVFNAVEGITHRSPPLQTPCG